MDRDDPLAFAKGLSNAAAIEAAAFLLGALIWIAVWVALP